MVRVSAPEATAVSLMMAPLGISIAAYVALRATCPGPAAPRLLLSLACGLIVAGVLSFLMLLLGR